jgi:DUF4097 and DUF4098 domain-containing protein YvlB
MSGTITVGKCEGPCRIKTKSGSAHVGTADSVDIHIGSGRVRIDHVTGSVNVRAVSGSVTLESGGGGPIEVETMSGSVTIVLPPGCRPDVRAKSLSSRPKIECERGEDCSIAVRTLSGRITVRCR